MTTATAPELSDDTLLHSFTARAMSAPELRTAIAATAAKMAKRLPGLTITTVVTDPWPAAWCTTHRGFADPERTVCYGRQAYGEAEYPGRCRVAPTRAVEVEVHAHGLPMWNGWTVAGVLTRDQQGVIAATTVGLRRDEADNLFADRHRHLMGRCEHCHKIRDRAVTVLLEHTESGEILPVGRTCLTEFTGSKIRVEALAALTALRERFAQAYGGVLTADQESAPTVDIVALASRYIALDGFHRAIEQDSTAVSVRRALMPAEGEHPTVACADLTAADLARAAEDIALIAASDDLSEYMANLRAAVAVDWTQISGRLGKVGLLASLPVAAARIRERAARAARAAAPVPAPATDAAPARVNAHIGDVGQKRPFHGTVVADREVETDDPNPYSHGGRIMVRKLEIDTPEGTVEIFGNKTRWPAATPAPGSLLGAGISVLATISRHGEYRGHRATRVIRVTVQAIR